MAAGTSQRLVRGTMLAAGGYWRPLAAAARLLEELGELSELLFVGDEPADGIADELADLWIITTALADQFLIEVEEPGGGSEAEADFGVLVAAAGPIARVANHYDGPKVPRQGEPMPTLQGSIAGFHMALLAFAAPRRIELAEAVAEKIERIHARGDIERFGREGFDPSTAPVLGGPLPERLPERLWGAPEPMPGERVAAYAARVRGPLVMFAKAARAERLEGVLIPGPHGEDAWLDALLGELDPGGRADRFDVGAGTLRARMLDGDAALALVELA
jgi:NTP pyrophosphatase (non-canonical NTP hydrolase)